MPKLIKKKKIPFPVSDALREYLVDNGREVPTVNYSDLSRFDNSISLLDKKGNDTLWETVFYPQREATEIHAGLKKVYSDLQVHGDLKIIEHLFIDRIDVCPFGNSVPFRVKIVNRMNDNFDYFYVKNADASRIYGLELEHLLSPNKIHYLVHKNTLIEEHIAGVPGDYFIKTYLDQEDLNRIRLAKEFVKFTERCFARLLGDMHASNFVIDITPDFEEIHYRIRAIDFDQQSYEGHKKVYLPQFFKENLPIVKVGLEVMTPESMRQYQQEERSLIRARLKLVEDQYDALIQAMAQDTISLDEHVATLRKELADHHGDTEFMKCQSMGQIVALNLKTVLEMDN